MARFDELDEQAQQEWQARIAQKRLALSASVEETLQDSSSELEEAFDEEDEQVIVQEPGTRNATLIPPRLSLQSKQLPAVSAQSPSHSTKRLLATRSEEAHEARSVDNIQTLARFTRQLAVVDGSISASYSYDTQNVPKIESVSPAQPLTHTGQIPKLPHLQTLPVIPRSPEPSKEEPDISRTLKRTTKVRLQVVPKLEPLERAADIMSPLCDAPTDPGLSAVEPIKERSETIANKGQVDVAGSGTFESGQAEVAVANMRITSESVVVVVLTGDPGPVVMQYVSLHPGVGFTVHLSAPTKNVTPFNYKVL